MKKIKVAAVSYLNTRPLLYGIRRHPVLQQMELVEDYPAKIARMLVDGRVDVGLIPVAAIPLLEQHHIITDYCIGAEADVASVCIFSQVPMEEIRTVYLDYQSRTSVNLARVLLREFWKKDVLFLDANGEEYRHQIKGTTAGVVIGDRALEQRLESAYCYDLAAAWREFTGLPFVFAAWIANKELPEDFVAAFNEANAIGFQHLDAIIAEHPFPVYDLKKYYTECISYHLSPEKRQGLKLFLEKLKQHQHNPAYIL
ncbi:menaquinone biosynthesis protein [Paraflavisolibacter sp. H34]|uniref:menaquinone biosynthetic enzyme MqnA/MqnD family protein n=1 Tax=Huijunlia imazamoxiresistens TaxID=3127457 RepID=UPI003018ED4B